MGRRASRHRRGFWWRSRRVLAAMAPSTAAAGTRRSWSGRGALHGRPLGRLRRNRAQTPSAACAWRRWRDVWRCGPPRRFVACSGERAGAPTGAVGATWPSSRGPGAGERGDAAGNAVDRRRRRGLSWERRGGEPSVSAARRCAAGQGGAGSGAGGSCKALEPSWPAAVDAAGTWAWRDVRRVRSRPVARRWAPTRVGSASRPSTATCGSRAHHPLMGSRGLFAFECCVRTVAWYLERRHRPLAAMAAPGRHGRFLGPSLFTTAPRPVHSGVPTAQPRSPHCGQTKPLSLF